MRTLLILVAAVLPAFAQAEPGDIGCTAKQFEITSKGMINEIEKPLTVDTKVGTALQLSVEIGDRAYSLSGDTKDGDFLLTQAYGEDYTSGMNATGSFTSTGRMQISVVDGNKVFKLECKKVSLADFPQE